MDAISKIFLEYDVRREEIEVSLSEMKQQISPYMDQILIYGAGSSGIAFVHQLNKIDVTPLYFIDSDEEKVNTSCEGIPVIAPGDILKKVSGEFLVIVCINTDGKRYCKSFAEALRVGGHHAVYEKLKASGCKNIIDYTYFRRCHALFTDERYNAPSCSDVYLMGHHRKAISQVYGWMADELSREIFEKIVRFRMLDDSIDVPTNPQERQYFEESLYEKKNDEIFVDCGAFNGISLKAFLHECGDAFEGYYGLEPDPDNYCRLEQYIYTLPPGVQEKINIFPEAVWKDNGGVDLYAMHGPGSFVADIGNTNVISTTIDGMLAGKRASYIKMNIEGSEKEALQGAEDTIKTYKPGLAVAGYHRTDDLWKIPHMVKSYREDYKIYLRSYMNHISFIFYMV